MLLGGSKCGGALSPSGDTLGKHGFLARAAPIATTILGVAMFLMAIAKSQESTTTIRALEWALGDRRVATVLAIALIAVEVVLAAAIIVRAELRLALWVTIGLLCAFLGWIGVLAWTDAPVGCGCGKVPLIRQLADESRSIAAVRALFLLVLAVIGLVGWSRSNINPVSDGVEVS